MKAIHLQVNHLFEPIGIDTVPSFFWHCEDGISQTAWRIQVMKQDEVLWDSGKVASSCMNDIRYEGKPLNSRDQCTWSVQLWDENDQAGEPAYSSFEMGLLKKEDFKAAWIRGNYKAKAGVRYPVDCFQKEFTLSEFRKGRLYAAARGVYDVFLNGKRIEDFILAPGITDYRKRIQLQTYDITEYLKEGNNVLELRLADGWYRGSSAAYGVTNVYGTETSVFAQLEIDEKTLVCTDSSFRWYNDGPIRFADLKDGEIYDARYIPSYRDHAVEVKGAVVPASANNVYVREKEHFPAKLIRRNVNRYILDLSQNIAGYVSFKVHAKEGEKLIITCGETLDGNQELDMKGIQLPRPAKGWNQLSLIMNLLGKEPKKNVVMTPAQRIIYTCKEGYNEYKTSFAVFGFRYMEVISEFPIQAEQFEGIAVYSDMEETGDFRCSNELINQFVSNVRWSMKSNFLDIPTDCPTRERLGWTGDAQIFFNSASYLMDVSSFFGKWLKDMEDAQYENGVLPAVFPYEGVEMMYKATGTSVGWADAVYLIPYRYYLRYNDQSILKKCWPMIRKYADYLFTHTGFSDKKEAEKYPLINQYVYEKGVHLGEWLEPEEFRDQVYGAKAKHPEEATAYFHYAMKTIREIAKILEESEYVQKCGEYAEGSKRAYNELFVKNGTIDTVRQAKLVRPLALGLLEGETKKNVQEQLKKAVEKYDHCVGTGFLSTVFLLPVLEEAGYADTAYRVLENEKAPGWLSEVKAGATSVWENWEGNLSLNHYSPGAAVEWLFDSVLGIRVQNGNRITLKPVFTDSLEEAQGHYLSIYGDIKASWKKEENGFSYTFTIPANTCAEVVLPDGTKKEFSAGTHTCHI